MSMKKWVKQDSGNVRLGSLKNKVINAILQTSGTLRSFHFQWTVPTEIPDLDSLIGSIFLLKLPQFNAPYQQFNVIIEL